ncbi:hypothetical protein ABFS83_07G025300 [Erythranthe nasuta]
MGQKKKKLQPWQKCSRYIQEQRTRLYIVWKCSVILIRWKIEGVSIDD